MTAELKSKLLSKDSLLQIVEKSATPIIIIDEKQIIIAINHLAEHLFHCQQTEILKKPLQEILPIQLRNQKLTDPALIAQAEEKLARQERRKGHSYRVVTGICKSGEKILVHISLTAIPITHGTAYFILLEKANANLKQQVFSTDHQRLQIIFELAPIGICQIDENWNCIYVNSNFCQLAGMNSDELSGRHWINAIHIDDCNRMFQEFRRALMKGEEYNAEFRFQTPLGKISWVACTARALFGSHGKVIGYLCTFKDITDQHKAQRSLEFLAHYDPLTQLANRTLLSDRLNQAHMRASRRGYFALLYLDLDGFKDINDSFGHEAGDMLLKQVAERLLRCVRKEDTIARLGGDEFTVLLEGVSDQIQVGVVAQYLVDSFKKAFYIADQQVFISTSLGISIGSGKDHNPQMLIKQADIAMYHAKESGRNTYKYYTPELNQILEQRLTLGNELHQAIEKEQLTLFYQPQVDAHTGQMVGAEALLRWPHFVKGFIPPSKFIPIMEERGLIERMGLWIFDHALEQKKQWNQSSVAAQSISLSINVSAKQFWRGNIYTDLQQALEKHHIPAEQIILEITESVLFKDGKFVGEVLKKLKGLGISIALDDFGTGYSSLSYLKRFPIDHIKIDRSFIQDIHIDAENTAITNAIIQLGHSLNMKVIAEGVDSHEKAQFLFEHGCDILQGHYFSEAIAPRNMPWQFNWQPQARKPKEIVMAIK